ncbi:hypothetical protein D3C86_1668190 [compost metagenome]
MVNRSPWVQDADTGKGVELRMTRHDSHPLQDSLGRDHGVSGHAGSTEIHLAAEPDGIRVDWERLIPHCH